MFTSLLLACVSPAAGVHTTPTPVAKSSPTGDLELTCEPARSRDDSGVLTVDGRHGVIGDAFTHGEDMNGSFRLVRRGAVVGDRAALHFQQIGAAAPAASVDYSVTASGEKTPWGDAAFHVGWKPISFSGSCWSLVVDGVNTGLVLALGR